MLSCSILLWSLAKLYQLAWQDSAGYQLELEQVFALQQRDDAIQTLPRSSLHLPAALAAQLDAGQIIALEQAGQRWYYQATAQDQLRQLGPVEILANDEVPAIDWLIYGALALLFLSILAPLFRDIIKLSRLTREFSRQPAPLQPDIARHSSLYPLAQSVQAMSENIHQLLQQQQDIARTIAHETRTPLARMQFTIRLAAASLEPRHTRQLQQDISEIDALVSNYLDFSRLEFFQPQSLQLHPVQPWLDDLRDKFDIYQADMQLEFDSPLQQAHFLPAALTLAAQNLLSNALRYASQQIRLQLQQQDGHYWLQVADDGPGIQGEPEQLTSLFQRGDNSSGFGFGLYIVNKVALWHGGRLEISNQPARGACISLIWPAQSGGQN